jgi:uncharacterized membrane protein YkvA (DUF1232 family)
MKTLAKIGRVRALVRYFRDREASILGKLFVLAAVIYVISPVDLIPDAFPVIGWLDDMGVMSLAVAWMWKVVGRYREAPQLESRASRVQRVQRGVPEVVA